MNNQYYWTLTIEPGWTQAAIWTIEDSTNKVLAVGPATRWSTEDELLNAVDASLSSCSASLGEQSIEPSKTVFGVPPSWVSEGQIKREHLDKMRVICSKLSLEPTGFVVLTEAIAHFVKAQEGSPLNGIVIGVGEDYLDIAVFKLGNLAGTVNVGRSVSVVDDVVEGLARFGIKDALPSRILLYNGKSAGLEEVRQSLIKADWAEEKNDKITFLHTPAIEIVEPDKKVVAVSLAGASEMSGVKKVLFDKKNKDEENESEEVEETVEDNQDLGFVINKDINQDDNLVATTEKFELPTQKLSGLVNKYKSKIVARFPKKHFHTTPVAPHLTAHSFDHAGRKSPLEKKPLTFGLAFLIMLAILGFVLWWFVPKAQITIYVAPRQLEERVALTVDPQSGLDIEQKVLPGHSKGLTLEGDKTSSTSGTKVVGEKSKGKVQIRNGTSVGIKVNSGTTLFGPNDLRFVVDTQASVSAALSPSTPGTQTVEVTAEKIGSDYNLAKGETFKVGNYPVSEVDAVAEENLSGGSSREITAVSAEDLKNLEAELVEELTQQGKLQLAAEAGENEIFIPESIKTTIKDKNFSNKLGDEASNIKLSLSLSLGGISVTKSDLNELAKSVLVGQVPGGFVLKQEQIDINFSSKGQPEGGKWLFDTTFTANLLPEIKPDEVARKISGKYPAVAQDYLSTIPGFVRTQIRLSPSFLPAKLAVLPRVVGNINIEIAAE